MLAALQIAEEGHNHQHGWDNDHKVVPDEPSPEHHARRDGEQEHGQQRTDTTEPAAHRPDQQYGYHSEQCHPHSCRSIGGTQQEVDQRREVVEQRSMVHRVVAIALTGDQLPGFPGMRAFIMTVGAVPQVPQTREDQHQHNQAQGNNPPVDAQYRENWLI